MRKLMPFASLTALIIGVFVALTVAGAFDDDDPQTEGETVSAVCADGFEDCVDTVVANDGAGDDEDAGLPPVSRDDLSQTCETGTADCGDDIGPVPPADSEPAEPNRTDDESLAIEAAFTELQAIGGPPSAEVEVSGIKSVTWNDGCLGVETPGIACIQVITPGYTVFLSGAGGDYEFHTDTMGNAVFAPQE